jgi:hypothetical protein
MATGTVGGCAKSGCHGSSNQRASASACFTWLDGDGFIAGGINDNGLFIWTQDGFMPQNGPTSEPQAVSDYAAWTAAGSQNN